MARLQTTDLLAPSTPKMTISTWFRILATPNFDWHSASDLFGNGTDIPPGSTDLDANIYNFREGNLSLFEFGKVEGGSQGGTYDWGAVQICPYYADTPSGFGFNPTVARGGQDGSKLPLGAKIKFTILGPLTPDVVDDRGFPFWAYTPFASTSEIFPFAMTQLVAYIPNFNFSRWHHLMCVADFSTQDSFHLPISGVPSEFTITQGTRMAIYLDRVKYVGKVAIGSALNFIGSEGGTHNWYGTSGSFVNETVPAFNPIAQYNTLWYGRHLLPTDGITSDVDTTNPVHDFVVNHFGLPTIEYAVSKTLADGDHSPPANAAQYNYFPIAYSDVQVWQGQYIDPSVVVTQGLTDATTTTNLDFFITKTGFPINPTEARSKFGQQTILFRGNHSPFVVNAGTGRAFSGLGTISDYTPTPSLG